MRILLVEDNQDFADSVRGRLEALSPPISLCHVQSRDAALTAMNQASFDLCICDLKIPTQDGLLDPDPVHGQLVIDTCLMNCPGTIVIVLTALQDQEFVQDLLNEYSVAQHIWDADSPVRMIQFHQKRRVDKCLTQVGSLRERFAEIAQIPVSLGLTQANLTHDEKTVLRLFCRRMGGNQLNVVPLNGGLSGSRVLRVVVQGADGGSPANAAAKVASICEVRDERGRYTQHIVRLAQGAFAHHQMDVLAGAGGKAGIFYQLAGDPKGNLFELLKRSVPNATAAVDHLRRFEDPWIRGVNSVAMTIGEVRRMAISDQQFARHRDLLRSIDIDTLESKQVFIRRCSQHGDLHGANIIIGDGEHPVLIDYGDADTYAAGLDAVTLELSTFFHSGGKPSWTDHWPTTTHFQSWTTFAEFVEGCPFADYIRSCRAWAHEQAGTDQAVHALGYAYAMRQLKYPDTNKEWALAIARNCAETLLAS